MSLPRWIHASTRINFVGPCTAHGMLHSIQPKTHRCRHGWIHETYMYYVFSWLQHSTTTHWRRATTLQRRPTTTCCCVTNTLYKKKISSLPRQSSLLTFTVVGTKHGHTPTLSSHSEVVAMWDDSWTLCRNRLWLAAPPFGMCNFATNRQASPTTSAE